MKTRYQKKNEFNIQLKDILDGKNLYLKKDNTLANKIKELEIKLNDEINKNNILNCQIETFKTEISALKNKNKNLEDELRKEIINLTD